MSYADGVIECQRCGTYAPCTDTCDLCGAVLHIGVEPLGCRGDPKYHESRGHGMGGGFVEYWDEHIAPTPGEHFKPNFAMPEFHPDKGYRITSLADRRKIMRLSKLDYRSHPGRSEY